MPVIPRQMVGRQFVFPDVALNQELDKLYTAIQQAKFDERNVDVTKLAHAIALALTIGDCHLVVERAGQSEDIELGRGQRSITRLYVVANDPNGYAALFLSDGTNAGKVKYDFTSDELQLLNRNDKGVAIRDTDGSTLISDGLVIHSSGAKITKHLSGTKVWQPGGGSPIADGAAVSTTVTVNGCALGDTVAVGTNGLGTNNGWVLSAHVTASNTVTLTVVNHTGASRTPGSATFRVDVWQH